jgi:hypothetical protein
VSQAVPGRCKPAGLFGTTVFETLRNERLEHAPATSGA